MKENTPKKGRKNKKRSPIGDRLLKLGRVLKKEKKVHDVVEYAKSLEYAEGSLKSYECKGLTKKAEDGIKAHYPFVNIDWVKTGEGEMFLADSSTNVSIENVKTSGGDINLNNGRDQHIERHEGGDLEYKIRYEALKEQIELYRSQLDLCRKENDDLRKMIDRLISNGTNGISK